MKDIRVLFLAPNWRVSLLRSFKKPTAIKIFIVGADSDSNSAALSVVDKSYVIPKFSEPNITHFRLFHKPHDILF